MEIDQFIDAVGLACPMPILKFKQNTKTLATGSIVKVTTSDPDSVNDFNAYSKHKGYRIIDRSVGSNLFEFIIQI
ncbi:sulfurtransferase TusA family protein [Catenovulum maritimum]|uniref:UPF0033 domain-containing protein n=1 Tax=Catenovulum maritimum TaxID=1513271 RepID=A0A0J8GNA4_9ALTE|nr:sulfurtransferase TusA family protein [Catenovulum maritimum]KMT64297.1 hypothetical protein XM47_14975 [Catenovulum maritimum]